MLSRTKQDWIEERDELRDVLADWVGPPPPGLAERLAELNEIVAREQKSE